MRACGRQVCRTLIPFLLQVIKNLPLILSGFFNIFCHKFVVYEFIRTILFNFKLESVVIGIPFAVTD